MNKKLSVIVPNYNNEKFLKKSVEYLIKQSYKNIEIIVVNDGSKGNCDEIMKEYLKLDNRVKYIKHDVNKGLFQARLTGADQATGDYIAFLDADDYASIDFYRTLVNNAEENNSDMVIGNTVLEFDNGEQIEFPLFRMNFKELNGKECIDEYFNQEGLIYSWHTVWNKIYSMDIWNKARKHYQNVKNRLIMTEDFAFSTVLFYYANKITTVKNDAIFYCQHNASSTSVENVTVNKAKNNIKDLITSFDFVEIFLKEVGIYDEYRQNFLNWKKLLGNQHRDIVSKIKKIKEDEKNELNQLLDQYCRQKSQIKNQGLFYSVKTGWNDRLEKIKLQIMDKKISYVSFDIFDTLVVRPFYSPIDLFKILDREYLKTNIKNGIAFSKMRVTSEAIARDEQYKRNSKIEDITLDDIYNTINKLYDVDIKLLNQLKEKEKELEVKFCTRRNTAYELYTLAIACGKKVICTSDMYLPENTILQILNKNGYTQIEKLYLSCSVKKAKWTGNLYKHVLEDLNIKPSEMVHIGDNYESDYRNAQQNEINAVHLIKTTEAMNNSNNLNKMLNASLPFWQDNKEAMQFIGVRTMLAVVANKYFDNPYRSFHWESDFNADPYLIGYYALGMYSYGVAKWLIDNTTGVNDKISFMARDGYLMMEAYNILSKIYKNAPKAEYLYVSRKALIPVMISNKLDFYKMAEIVYHANHSPKGMLKYLKNVAEIDVNKLQKLCEKEQIKFDKNFKTIEDFNKFLKIVANNFYNEEKHSMKRNKLKKYFNDIIGERPAVFDVGYSGRPEYYLSDLCGKKLDTYFLNINKDEGLEYANNGGYKLKTYFNAKPTSTGNAYELLLSKLAPSCIGYDCTGENVEPVFEKYEKNYPVEYIVDVMQKAAIEFVYDMCDIFDNDLDILYYQDYYISLPIMAYINSARMIDKLPLSAVEFEDDIGFGKNRKMIDDMQQELNSKNQCSLQLLFERNNISTGLQNIGKLNYNLVDLNNKNRFTRLIYYILFDRKTIKRRIGEVTYKFRHKK
ncbi:MAG: glycosyltransferase [Clostridia bacterium]|nr:glycosyltransferase [Clostridia bacterium]